MVYANDGDLVYEPFQQAKSHSCTSRLEWVRELVDFFLL